MLWSLWSLYVQGAVRWIGFCLPTYVILLTQLCFWPTCTWEIGRVSGTLVGHLCVVLSVLMFKDKVSCFVVAYSRARDAVHELRQVRELLCSIPEDFLDRLKLYCLYLVSPVTFAVFEMKSKNRGPFSVIVEISHSLRLLYAQKALNGILQSVTRNCGAKTSKSRFCNLSSHICVVMAGMKTPNARSISCA